MKSYGLVFGRSRRTAARFAPLVALAGCAPVAAVLGFSIAAGTFVFLLNETGVIEATAGGVGRKAGVVTLPFDDVPVDRPANATLNVDVGTTRALPLDATSKSATAQALTGAAQLTVYLGPAGATNPCTQGERVGTFQIGLSNGNVSISNPSLALNKKALEYAISGAFTICFELTTTVNVKLILGEMSITFGEEGGSPAPLDPAPPASPLPAPNPTPDPDPTPGPTPDPDPDPDPAPTPDLSGFLTAQITHRGYERIIAGTHASPETGFVLPQNFNIGRLALSGDGQYVWFYIYWDSITPRPSDWIRLYRVHTSGANLQRSQISEEADAIGGGYLATNLNGATAVFEMKRCEPDVVTCRPESRFLRLSPGMTAQAFYDTENDAAFPSSTGLRMTGDGARVYWHHTERFWSIGTSGGTALELASVAHLNFYGPWDPFTGGQIIGMDISADGSQWLLGIRFTDPQTNQLRWELIRAGGALPQNLTGLPKQTSQQIENTVQLSDDGQVVGYAESNAFGTGGTFVQSAEFAVDLRSAASPTAHGAYGMVVADSGRIAFCEVNFSNERTPVFHDVATGERLRAGSTRYARTAGGVHSRQLSDDGRTCVGLFNANPIGTPFNNLYVLREGAAAPTDHPQFIAAWYRYDDATDSLIVRAHVTSSGGLERIYLLPHKDGIEPNGAIAESVNPFWHERGAGGVNLSTLLTPVDGAPDTYQRSIRLDGKKQYIDGSYSLRLVAVDATGTRTSFCDLVPLR